MDNETTEAIRAAVAKTKAIGDEKANGAFYRMELLPRRTCVDTSLFHYRGMTVFASSNYYKSTKFLGSLGYAINGVNSHLYQSFDRAGWIRCLASGMSCWIPTWWATPICSRSTVSRWGRHPIISMK